MIFEALNWTVNQLIEEYECPECKWKITWEDINIIWAAGSAINMDVMCPECETSEYIEAQVLTLDFSQLLQNKDKINELSSKIKDISGYKEEITDVDSLLSKEDKIKDEEIISINKVLKRRNFSINDLFQIGQKV